MKKLFVITMALAISTSVFAGRPTGFTPGAGAIWDWSKTTFTTLPNSSTTENMWGYYAEVGYTYKFNKHHSIYGGLRGSEVFSLNATDIIGKSGNSLNLADKFYLDIPIRYNFNFDVSSKVQLFINAGPTLDFWLTYVGRSLYTAKDQAITGKIDFFKEYPNVYNRVNLGLGGALGVFFYGVKIEIGYDQYVIDFYKNIDGVKGSRGQLKIGAAYVF